MSTLAGVLARLGVSKGDRVLVYMPMISETVVAMLATVRLGGVHVVVFGGTYEHFFPTLIKAYHFNSSHSNS